MIIIFMNFLVFFIVDKTITVNFAKFVLGIRQYNASRELDNFT